MTITDKQAFDKYVETFGRIPSKKALEKFKATLQKQEDAKAKDLEKEKPESSEETLPNENENAGSTTPENPNAGGQPDSSSNTGSQDTPPSDSSPEQPAPAPQPEAPKSTISDKQAFDKYVETFGRVPSKRALEKFKATLAKEKGEVVPPKQPEADVKPTPQPPQDGNNQGGSGNQNDNTAPAPQPEAPKSTISDKQAFDKYVETFGRIPSKRALEKFKATLQKQEDTKDSNKPAEKDFVEISLAEFLSLNDAELEAKLGGKKAKLTDKNVAITTDDLNILLSRQDKLSDENKGEKVSVTFANPAELANLSDDALALVKVPATIVNKNVGNPAVLSKLANEKFADILGDTKLTGLNTTAQNATALTPEELALLADDAITITDADTPATNAQLLAIASLGAKLKADQKFPAKLTFAEFKAILDNAEAKKLLKDGEVIITDSLGGEAEPKAKLSKADLTVIKDNKTLLKVVADDQATADIDESLLNKFGSELSLDEFKNLTNEELALLADGKSTVTNKKLTIKDAISLTNLKEKLALNAIKLVETPASQLDALADFVGADKFESVQLTDNAITLASFKDVEDSPIKDKLVQPLPPLEDTLENIVVALKDNAIASKLNATDEAKKVTITDIATARTDKDGAKILFANKDKLKADTKVGVDVEVDEVADLLEDDSSATGSVLDVIKDQSVSLSDKDTATATPETLGEIKKLKDGGKLLDGELVAKVEVPLSGVAGFVAKEAGDNGVDLKDLAADGAITITETTAPATKAQILAIASLDAKLKAGQKFPAKMTFAEFKEVVANNKAKALLKEGEVIITDSLGGEDETKAQLTKQDFNLLKANKALLKAAPAADDPATENNETLLNKFNVEMSLTDFKTLTTEDLALLPDGSVTISASDKSQAIYQADLAGLVADNRDAKLAATEKFKASLRQDDIKDASKFTAKMAKLIKDKGLSISDKDTAVDNAKLTEIATNIKATSAENLLADDGKLTKVSVTIDEFIALINEAKALIATNTLDISDKDTQELNKAKLDAVFAENSKEESLLKGDVKFKAQVSVKEFLDMLADKSDEEFLSYSLAPNGTTFTDNNNRTEQGNTKNVIEGMTTLNKLLALVNVAGTNADAPIAQDTKFFATLPLDEAVSTSNKTNIIKAVKDAELVLAPATAAVGTQAPTEVVLKNSDLTYFTTDDQFFAKLKNKGYKAELTPDEVAKLAESNNNTNKNDNKKMLIANDGITLKDTDSKALNNTEITNIKTNLMAQSNNKIATPADDAGKLKADLSIAEFVALAQDFHTYLKDHGTTLNDDARNYVEYDAGIKALAALDQDTILVKLNPNNINKYKVSVTLDQFKGMTTSEAEFLKDGEGITISNTSTSINLTKFKDDFLGIINGKPELKDKLSPTSFSEITSATIDEFISLDERTVDEILSADTNTNAAHGAFKFVADSAFKAVAKATGDLTFEKFVKLAAHIGKLEAGNDYISKENSSQKEINVDSHKINMTTAELKKLAESSTDLIHFAQDGKIHLTDTSAPLDNTGITFFANAAHSAKLENSGANTFSAELTLAEFMAILKDTQNKNAKLNIIRDNKITLIETTNPITKADFDIFVQSIDKLDTNTKVDVKFDIVNDMLAALESTDQSTLNRRHKTAIAKASIGDDDTTPNEVADKAQFDKIVAVKAQIADGEKFKFADNSLELAQLLAITDGDLSLLADAASAIKADQTIDSMDNLRKLVDDGYYTKLKDSPKFEASLAQNDLIDIKDKYIAVIKPGSVTLSEKVTDVLLLGVGKDGLKEELTLIKDASITEDLLGATSSTKILQILKDDEAVKKLATDAVADNVSAFTFEASELVELPQVAISKIKNAAITKVSGTPEEIKGLFADPQYDALLGKIADNAIKMVEADATKIKDLITDTKFNTSKAKFADNSLVIENDQNSKVSSTDLKAIANVVSTQNIADKFKDGSISFISVDAADFAAGIQDSLTKLSSELKSTLEVSYENAKGAVKLSDKKDVLKVATDATDLNATEFTTGTDKVDFSALNVTKEATKVSLSANKELATGKLYFLEDQSSEAVNDASKLIAKFADKITAAADASVVVAVKDNTSTQLFKITNGSDNNTIEASEVSVIGSVAGLDIGDIM